MQSLDEFRKALDEAIKNLSEESANIKGILQRDRREIDGDN